MISIDNNYLRGLLDEHFAGKVLHTEEPFGFLTVEISKDALLPVMQFLKTHPELQMNFLTTLCGLHFPDQKGRELGVMYQLHSWVNNIRLRIKVFMPSDNPHLPSVTSVFEAANWQERETYDFYGIIFEGHPKLKRILNVDHMDYFPLRKEYPLEDATRDDKQDKFFGR